MDINKIQEILETLSTDTDEFGNETSIYGIKQASKELYNYFIKEQLNELNLIQNKFHYQKFSDGYSCYIENRINELKQLIK